MHVLVVWVGIRLQLFARCSSRPLRPALNQTLFLYNCWTPGTLFYLPHSFLTRSLLTPHLVLSIFLFYSTAQGASFPFFTKSLHSSLSLPSLNPFLPGPLSIPSNRLLASSPPKPLLCLSLLPTVHINNGSITAPVHIHACTHAMF